MTGWRDLGNGYVEFEYPDDVEAFPEPRGLSPVAFAFNQVLSEQLAEWFREQTAHLERTLEESRPKWSTVLPVGITSTVDRPPWRGASAHRVWVDEARSMALLGVGPDLDVTRWRCLGGEWVPA